MHSGMWVYIWGCTKDVGGVHSGMWVYIWGCTKGCGCIYGV